MIENRQAALDRIFNRYSGESLTAIHPVIAPSELTQGDKDLCARIASSRQGDKFRQLFAGDRSEYGSQSEADLAMCSILAFWCKKDIEQMDRIFRQSGLFRSKWDEIHGKEKYGTLSLSKAIAGTTRVYEEGGTTAVNLPPKTRRFRFTPASTLIADRKPADWLIRPFIERATIGADVGPPESLKSFLVIDQGLSIAAGRAWHGHQVEPGAVLYCCGEGHAGIGRRIEAWLKYHGITGDVPFFVSNGAAQLLDPASLAEVEQAADEITATQGEPVLIIIDTLNRNFGPGDENSTSDMTKFVSALDHLRDRLGCAIMLVHHCGISDQARGRGSSVLHGAMDFEFLVERSKSDSITDSVISLKPSKTKDHDKPPAMAFRPVIVPLGLSDDGEPITSLILEPTSTPEKKPQRMTGPKRIAYTALLAVAEETGKAHVDDWRKEAYTRGISASDKPDAKQKAFNRAVKQLLDEGLVATRDDFYWPEIGNAEHCPTIPDIPDRPGQVRTMSGSVL